ncbi:hypothetical protein D3C72_2350760 [compost metagenome]
MGLHSAAGLRYAWSGLSRCNVQGMWPRSTNCSKPFISVAVVRPYLNQFLKLRSLFSSVCSQLFSKASG